MAEDSPEIVNIDTSPELFEFLSEAELEVGAADAPATSPPPREVVSSLSRTTEANVASGLSRTTEPNVASGLSRTTDDVIQTTEAALDADRPSTTADHSWLARLAISQPPAAERPAKPEAAQGTAQQRPHAPATVTEFPVRPHTPPAVALPSLPPGPASLVELIERRGGFDWREAVAVIHQICLYLRDHSPQSPILLDPRTIQITERGEVRLLSGQSSSDPLVIQVGRLLRSMLMGKEAPPELRLLLAQATFELPIFESIEDVDRALAQLNKLDEPGPAGLALLRAVAAPPPPPTEEEVEHRPPPIRSILPTREATGRRRRRRSIGQLFGGYGSQVAVIFGAIAVIGILLATKPALLFPVDDYEPPPVEIAPVESAGVAPVAPAPAPSQSASSAGPAPAGNSPAPPEGTRPPRPTVSSSSTSTRPASSSSNNAEPRPTSSNGTTRPPDRQASAPVSRAGTVVVRPLPSSSLPELSPNSSDARPRGTGGENTTTRRPADTPTPRDTQRFASSMLEKGQAVEASMAFDGMVMANPLYDPRTTDLSPEALAAFRASQRSILPVAAQNRYDRALAANADGDFERAVALGREALAIIDRRLGGTPMQLREQVLTLVGQASAAAAAANDIVYTDADRDVTPPVQVTRQMPEAPPIGVPPHRIGWLDMIIGRDGMVETIRLNTPLNTHHDRMIVSPAKSWLFRPAMRNGRPVRYRITMKINLPESGTNSRSGGGD